MCWRSVTMRGVRKSILRTRSLMGTFGRHHTGSIGQSFLRTTDTSGTTSWSLWIVPSTAVLSKPLFPNGLQTPGPNPATLVFLFTDHLIVTARAFHACTFRKGRYQTKMNWLLRLFAFPI